MTETTRLLHDLVALPSVNPMGRSLQGPEFYEAQVTAYLENFFRGLGVPYARQPVAPQRDNIVAHFKPPGAQRTVLLEVHQDTVPVDNMTIEPFGARIEDGKLYGRGACDVKGGMASMLAAFARLVRDKPAGAMNVTLACTVDEEHTFLGVQELVGQRLTADMAIVAEPTQLRIVHAHKGVVRWYLTTVGRSCHSSTPEEGVNAIYNMAGLLVLIQQYAEWLRTSRTDPLLGRPSLSVGRIEGGSSVNTVPDTCRIEIDRRLIPGEDPRAAAKELESYLRQSTDPTLVFESSEPWLLAPPLVPAGSDELVARLGRQIEAIKGYHQVISVPYGTDAAAIAQTGIPAVVFGPGDIAQAHTCDEWVSLEEVEQASEILYRFICAST
jgi:acetylornithine deacetylase ArgE